jgi:hypothetical protein
MADCGSTSLVDCARPIKSSSKDSQIGPGSIEVVHSVYMLEKTDWMDLDILDDDIDLE